MQPLEDARAGVAPGGFSPRSGVVVPSVRDFGHLRAVALLGLTALVLLRPCHARAQTEDPAAPSLDVSEHAFNRGDALRLTTAELMSVLREEGAKIWRYHDGDWIKPDRAGHGVSPDELENWARGGERLWKLVEGYRFDWNQDGRAEVLLVPRYEQLAPGHFSAPTMLGRDGAGSWKIVEYPRALPGESFELEDIRDQNGDGRLEVVLSGRGGTNTYYTYFSVWAVDDRGQTKRLVTKAPDTLHVLDLQRSGRYQLLIRMLTSQQGQPHTWTWVDHLTQWNGREFKRHAKLFAHYHDQVSKRRLVDELIDCSGEDPFILRVKVEVLRQIHAHVLSERPIQVAQSNVTDRARSLAALGQLVTATELLEEELRGSPYDVSLLDALAEVKMAQQLHGEALSVLYRLLGVAPDSGSAWFKAGLCFARLQERTNAVASFVNSVRIPLDGMQRREKLEAARAAEPDAAVRAALTAAVAVLDGKPYDPGDTPGGLDWGHH
jgi:tetratricopeptide (TPR) repeat protein